MVNNDYLVDTSYMDDSGSYCDFLPIKGEDNLGFKSFKLKTRADETYKIQKKLAKFNLAPQIITEVCKIPYSYDPELLKYWTPEQTVTSWGYVTEKAVMLDIDDMPYEELENLVNKIREKTGLKFWDCHWTNVGYINNRLVCIDTGKVLPHIVMLGVFLNRGQSVHIVMNISVIVLVITRMNYAIHK